MHDAKVNKRTTSKLRLIHTATGKSNAKVTITFSLLSIHFVSSQKLIKRNFYFRRDLFSAV